MKSRSDGFLSNEKINHKSEQFDYIRELHEYLWGFIRCTSPGQNGDISDFMDNALDEAKNKMLTNINNSDIKQIFYYYFQDHISEPDKVQKIIELSKKLGLSNKFIIKLRDEYINHIPF